MIKRFSVECVLFWMEVEVFRAVPAQAENERRETAIHIVARYIMADAQLKLDCLPAEVREQVESSVMGYDILTPSIFDEAQSIVLRYMENESWEDFLRSKDCAKLMDRLRRHDTIRQHLVSAGMVGTIPSV